MKERAVIRVSANLLRKLAARDTSDGRSGSRRVGRVHGTCLIYYSVSVCMGVAWWVFVSCSVWAVSQMPSYRKHAVSFFRGLSTRRTTGLCSHRLLCRPIVRRHPRRPIPVELDRLVHPPISPCIAARSRGGVWHASFADALKDLSLLALRMGLPVLIASFVAALCSYMCEPHLTMRWSERRTAVRSTFEMTSTLPLRATRALVRRRSSCSR